eukprot:TRINITY_DN1207_c1_g2_i1.p1 TRINITY_DN1207_c1_g2~~TRINITY_DN1207_c1_g2_i1.p1  ORF type:complete len:325 (-),score=62.20 TRINITY_DN1207_c1_g2_i1:145-1119(-)
MAASPVSVPFRVCRGFSVENLSPCVHFSSSTCQSLSLKVQRNSRFLAKQHGIVCLSLDTEKEHPAAAENRQQELLPSKASLAEIPDVFGREETPTRQVASGYSNPSRESYLVPVNMERLQGVYLCGGHSKKSHGRLAYFIQRPEGNLLVDSPRFSESLSQKIDLLGGVEYLILTKWADADAADAFRWQARFRCTRVMHALEGGHSPWDVEMQLQGAGPWSVGSDINILFTPGLSLGCVSVLVKPLQALFTGESLVVANDSGKLAVADKHTAQDYSGPKQVASLKKLLPVDFLWMLPGKGQGLCFDSMMEKNDRLRELLESEELL